MFDSLVGDATSLLDGRFPWAAGFAALAGFVRGFSGFGAALIFIPWANIPYDPATAIIALWVIDAVASAPLLPPHLRRAAWREVVPLLVGSAVAMPFGVWILSHTDPYELRLGVCGMVLISTLCLASGWRYRQAPTLPVTLSVGGVAGFTSGAVGIGGPPLVLFWLAGQANAVQARSNIFAYFALTTFTAIGPYIWQDLFTARRLVLGAALTPVYALTMTLGDRLFRRTGETAFRQVAFWLCAAAAILGLPMWR